MFIRNAWYTAAWAHEITEQPLARRLLDEPIVIFRDKQGHVGALEDSCCHRGAPLSFGRVVEAGLQCGYHGMVFDCEGACVRIPGQTSIPSRSRVRSYPVVEKDETIWIWMGDPALADVSKIIDFPYHNDQKNWPHKYGRYHIKANYMLLVDNLMDLTHVGYVHAKTIGGSPSIHIEARMDTVPSPTGLKFTRWMLDTVPPPTYAKAFKFKGNVDRWQEFEYIAPAHIVQYSGAKDIGGNAYGGDRDDCLSVRLIHGLTPETETSCFYFWSIAHGFSQDDPKVTQFLYDELADAFMEDKITVEGQQERLNELGQQRLVDIASDRARVHMRRTVDRLLAEEAQPQGAAL